MKIFKTFVKGEQAVNIKNAQNIQEKQKKLTITHLAESIKALHGCFNSNVKWYWVTVS